MIIKTLLLVLSISTLTACANHQNDSVTEHHDQPIKRICSPPPAPQNIWKLEPMLKDKGLIKDGMSREQKEVIIRDYINKKNSAYTKCDTGK
jgi:hypothetical protein